MANLTNINNKFLVTTGGNVGINTTSPDSKLDVTGGDITVNTTGTGFMNFKYSNSQKGTIGTDGIDLKITANADLQLLPASNVGIGTASPSRKLTIGNGNGFVNNQISLLDGGGTEQATIAVETTTANDLLVASKANLRFFTGSTIGNTTTLPTNERMRITSGGNVGIGVTPSTAYVDSRAIEIGANGYIWSEQTSSIYSSFMTGVGFYYNVAGATMYKTNSLQISRHVQYQGEHIFQYAAAGTAGQPITWSEAFRTSDTGNVGIGTDSPSEKLEVSGGNIRIENSSTQICSLSFSEDNTNKNIIMEYDGTGSGADNYFSFYSNVNGWMTKGSSLNIQPSTGNVGIGTTSPTAKLEIKDSANNNSNLLTLYRPNSSTLAASKLDFSFNTVDGTQAVYSRIRSDVDGNANSAQSGSLSFWTPSSGTLSERMHIASGGNVTIKETDSVTYSATTPVSDLVIERKNTDNTNGETVGIRFAVTGWSGSTTGGAAIQAIQNSNVSSADLAFLTRNAGTWGEKMRIDSRGNTTHIASYAGGTFPFRVGYGSYSSFTPTFVIDDNGDVGIGTTNPLSRLHINSSDAGLRVVGSIRSQILVENSTSSWQIESPTSAGNVPAGALGIIEAGIGARLSILTGGNVGIGLTSPSDKLEVTTSTSQYTGRFDYTGSSGGAYGCLKLRISANTSPSFIDLFYDGYSTNPLTPVGAIVTTGSAVLYSSFSDYRLKENIADLTGALDKVNSLQPKTFNYINRPEATNEGFLAHELQEIVPQAVSGTKDGVDENGNPKYQGVDNAHLVPLLVGAIKELKADNDSLRARIETLENK